MRCLLGPLVVLIGCCAVPAADPGPDDAIKLLDRMKAKYRKDKKSDKVVLVDLGRKRISDSDLKTIAALTTVRQLNLEGVVRKDVSDRVAYAAAQIGDAGVKHLAGMTDLRQLTLSGTHVTDAGLKHLATLKNLEVLSLNNTKVTDAGMQHLTRLPKLRSLNLFDTKVTDAGVGALKRGNPDLKIGR